MTDRGWEDDDRLLAALAAALAEDQPAPRSFVEAGKAAFAWHNVEIELAALTYDSARDMLLEAAARAEPAALRALTFAASRLTIELEVGPEGLVGQVVPPQEARIELITTGGAVTVVRTDEVGGFAVRPLPEDSFRIHCQTSAGDGALTDWVTL